MKYFRPYVYGRKFTIKTDHRPLIWLHNLRAKCKFTKNAKLQRWKIKLEEFNFDIVYVDALSRVEVNVNEVEVDEVRSTDATMHSADEDGTDYIPISEGPLNFYKTQIIIKTGSPEKLITKQVAFLIKEHKIIYNTTISYT